MKKILTSFYVFLVVFLGFFAVIFGYSYLQKASISKDLRDFNRDVRNYNSKLQVMHKEVQKLCEFNIAIADTDSKRAYGLMNLNHMPQQNGMLFFFAQESVINMWMKNTLIPLDMIFIDKSNQIISIKTDAQPMSLDNISSQKNADKVLEINAGEVKKCGIETGQKVIIEINK